MAFWFQLLKFNLQSNLQHMLNELIVKKYLSSEVEEKIPVNLIYNMCRFVLFHIF